MQREMMSAREPSVAARQLELEVSQLTQTDRRDAPGQTRLQKAEATTEPAPHDRGLTRPSTKSALPRLALTFAESAAMLGVSDEFFAQHVASELRWVRRGRKKLVAMRELERWL